MTSKNSQKMEEQRVWHQQQKEERSESKEGNIMLPQEEPSQLHRSERKCNQRRKAFFKAIVFTPIIPQKVL